MDGIRADKVQAARLERQARLKEELLAALPQDGEISDDEVRRAAVRVVMDEHRRGFLTVMERTELCGWLFATVRGLGVLQTLVDDDDVSEIMVNGKDDVFCERRGEMQRWSGSFSSEEELMDTVRQIAGRCDRTVNAQSPIVDARLPDGSRVNAVVAPAAINGPILTIRKFPKDALLMEALIANGAVSREAAEFLRELVERRYSILIGGGTSAGKTTFLNALSAFIPKGERIITIEDTAELSLQGVPNLVRLEAKAANIEGTAEVTMRDLIKSSLRMRPDRIVVGEVRGGEAVDLLQALNTGHDGSLSTIHANSAEDMLSRLEMMVLMAFPLPLPAIRRQIASGVEALVYLKRIRGGRRLVTEIAEIEGMDGDAVKINTLFALDGRGGLVRTGELRHAEKFGA